MTTLRASSAMRAAAQRAGYQRSLRQRRKDIGPSSADFGRLLFALQYAYPETFARPVPLAVGIKGEIQELIGDQFDAAVIDEVLRWHTDRRDYLAAVAAGGSRFHLDGSQASQIEARHKTGAAKRFTIINKGYSVSAHGAQKGNPAGRRVS